MKRVTVLSIVLLFFSLFPLFAHRISMSWIVADISSDKAIVDVEIMPEDFIYYYGMAPDSSGYVTEAIFDRNTALHSQRIRDGLILLNGKGLPVMGRVKRVRKNLRGIKSSKGLDFLKLIETPLTYQLEYLFEAAPSSVTFSQMFAPLQMGMPSVSELSVAQSGFLPGPPITLSNDGSVHVVFFDWQRRRLPLESLEEERARFDEERRQRQLGIIKYNDIYAFFYVEEYRVRMELIMPLLLLETFIDLKREHPLFLSIEEQTKLQPDLRELIDNRVGIQLNGQSVKGRFLRADFYGLDFTDFASIPDKREQPLVTARAGVMVEFVSDEQVKKGSVKWDLFNPSVYTTGALVFNGEHAKRIRLSTYTSQFHWVSTPGREANHSVSTQLSTPVKNLSVEDISQIGEELLVSLYGGFLYPSDEMVYDSLSLIIDDSAIEEIFLSFRETISQRDQGGVRAIVDNVEMESVEILSVEKKKKRISFRAQWIASGRIEHWGHLHLRKNSYQADFSIVQTDIGWKIDEINLIQSEPLSRQVLLREVPFD